MNRPLATAMPGAGAGWLARARTLSFALVIPAWLLHRLTGWESAQWLLALLAICAILVALPALSGAARLLSLLFLGSGAAMLAASGAGVAGFIRAFGPMSHLVALFGLVPLLAVPVRLGAYDQALSEVLRARAPDLMHLHRRASGLAYAGGSFMTMATIPIMIAGLRPAAEQSGVDNPTRFIVTSITCSHLLSMLWSPVSGALAAILTGLNVPWIDVLGVMLPLSVASLLATWAIYRLVEPAAVTPLPLPAPQPAVPLRPLLQLGTVILLLVLVVAALEQWLRLGLVTVVVITVIPFTLAWAAARGQAVQFIASARADLAARLPRMADMFCLFLCGGFFASALNLSGAVHDANLAMLALRDTLGATGFLLSLPAMAMIAALLGLHPLVAIAILAESLRPNLLGIPAHQLAISLTGGALLTYMLGPFGGTLGMVSAFTGKSTWTLSRWNLPYAMAYLALLLLALVLMRHGPWPG